MSGATDVIVALAAGRKSVQLYPQTHPAFVEAIGTLVKAVEDVTAGGPLTVNLHEGRLYDGSSVLPDEAPGIAAIQEAFEVRRIESMTFRPTFTAPDAIGLVEVLGLKPSPDLDVESELAARGVTAITLSMLADDDDSEREERDRLREADRANYSRLVAALRTMSAKIADGSATDLTAANTMLGNVMSRLIEDQPAVLALATMRSTDDTDLFHAINVMIYTLALGSALGLPEEGLSSLGLSALMHDIGKAAFLRDDASQAEAMRLMHPKVGADILTDLSADDPSPMLVAYEHHMWVDGGGYPERAAEYVGHPFSRMVAIADRFANLIGGTPDADPLTPDKAVVQILREAATRFDPLFARLFAKAMGVFPIGCLVRLSDHSVGVVSRPGDDPLTPWARVVFDSSGLQVEEPEEIDLSVAGLSILEVIEPDSLNTAIADHL